MFNWFLRKAPPHVVMWTNNGEVYEGDYIIHPSGKKNVVRSRKYVDSLLVCHPDGKVAAFDGSSHYIKEWKKF